MNVARQKSNSVQDRVRNPPDELVTPEIAALQSARLIKTLVMKWSASGLAMSIIEATTDSP